MIRIRHRGSFRRTERFLRNGLSGKYLHIFEKYGRLGVDALAANTSVDTGKTAASWSYEISRTNKGITLSWLNSNVQNGTPIAILLQYGHATRSGYFVQGRDYINPALKPIFDKLSRELWEEVNKT